MQAPPSGIWGYGGHAGAFGKLDADVKRVLNDEAERLEAFVAE